MKKNDAVTLEITDMTFDGSGIGHVDTKQGKFPVFVRAAAVGDVVQCRVIKVLKHYAAAIVTRIVSPSAHRVAPACPVAEKCGGCAFHHVSYQAELEYKTNAVRQAYKLNFSGEIAVNDCVPSPLQSHYRNKVQLPLSPEGKFGFYSLRSHRVIPVSDCSAAYGAFSNVITAVEEWIRKHQISPYDEATGKGLVRHLFLRRGHYSGETMVCLTVNAGSVDAIPAKDDLIEAMKQFPEIKSLWINFNSQKTNVILGDRFHLLFGAERIFDTMNGVRFAISPHSFYQVNTPQAEAIYAAAASYLSPDDILLDLYCGIGTIGLTCASKVKQVIGIEVVFQAVEDAKENAKRNGIENARFFASDAAKTPQILSTLPYKPTAVIVDPPRKGLSSDTITALREIAPEKIVYISCNPATQARDLALLRDSYVPGPVTPYDMFPRTGHVESVVCLTKK